MQNFVIVKGTALLAFEGKRDGQDVILNGEPEFFEDAMKPVITDRATATMLAKKHGGRVRQLAGRKHPTWRN